MAFVEEVTSSGSTKVALDDEVKNKSCGAVVRFLGCSASSPRVSSVAIVVVAVVVVKVMIVLSTGLVVVVGRC